MEKTIVSLQKCLCCNFQHVKFALEKGLETKMEDKAAVYSTAVVEAMCTQLFELTIVQMQIESYQSPHAAQVRLEYFLYVCIV